MRGIAGSTSTSVETLAGQVGSLSVEDKDEDGEEGGDDDAAVRARKRDKAKRKRDRQKQRQVPIHRLSWFNGVKRWI